VRGGLLHVPQRHPGVERGRDERAPKSLLIKGLRCLRRLEPHRYGCCLLKCRAGHR